MQIAKELRSNDVLGRALSGNLAEDFDPAVVHPKDAKHLILDLSRVSGVSSFGVREWVRGIRTAAELAKLWFVSSSPRMTDQFNMISGFDGGGTLLSFFGNYFCQSCSNETTALFDTQLDAEAFSSGSAPARQCRICGRAAELDDIPEALFEYASSHPVSEVPAEVEAFFAEQTSWIEIPPGRRYAIRGNNAPGNAKLSTIHGIVDVGFSLDSVSGPPEVSLALPHVQHFDESAGVARWNECLARLRRDRRVRLVAVPPVFLRRALTSPTMVAGVEVASVAYPTKCQQCDAKSLLHVDVRVKVDEAYISKLKCKTCSGGPMILRTPFADVREFHAFLQRSPEQVRRPEGADRKGPGLGDNRTGDLELPPFLAQSSSSRYELLCKVGEGGMADVYLVRQHGAVGFRRLVVIKVIRSEYLNDDRFVRMFIDEARLAARIDHPNIIRVHDLGRGGGAFFMVMDFLHGRSISEVLAQTAKQSITWPPGLAASVIADLCSGLARAHVPDSSGRSLVHRDVTPANVIIRFDGLVKLIDFGLAGYRHFSKDLNRAGQLVGNFAYIAPEVINGEEATPQLDIWGAGLILACLVTGKHPFKRNTPEETVVAMMRQPANLTGVPKSLVPILEKSLAKDPKQRYAKAADMENDLREAMFEFKREKRSGSFMRWFGKKGDEEAPLTLELLMRRLFSHQIRFENEFTRKMGAPHMIDALLDASPKDIARLFRNLKLEPSASLQPPGSQPSAPVGADLEEIAASA